MRPAFRLLPLPFCIAISLSAQAEDPPPDWGLCPVEDAIPAFEGAPAKLPPGAIAAPRSEQPTDIEGDSLGGVKDQSIEYQGNVALTRGDQFIGTDKLTYNEQTETYVAEGNVRYQDSGMRVVADRAEGNQGKDQHKIDNIRYQLIDRRGHGGAESIEMDGTEGSMRRSSYTTCPPDAKHWELRARQIDVDTEKGMGVARNATLRIGRVPVLYVPWFMFPIDDTRRTGLLYPSLSNSNRNGFDYRQPIYLNLAPNYDLTLNPRYMTNRGASLGAEFRYLNPRGAGTITGMYMPDDELRDRDRGHFTFNAFQNLSRHWRARSNLIWISDPRYFEDFSNSINGTSITTAVSTLGLYGRGPYWDASLMADHHQLADPTLTDANLPFSRQPRANFRWEQPFGSWIMAGVDAEAVRFHKGDAMVGSTRREFPGGSRLDLKPYVSFPLEGASWFLRPTLAWRHTEYRLDEGLGARLGGNNPSRSLPIASLDSGLFFDRSFRWRDREYLQTLEPRIFYLNVPYRDQSNLPVFDTRLLSFSWGQLFRDNRYSGADRQTDANQLTVAVSSRMIRGADGFEKLSMSLGQIRYFEDSQVTLPNERTTQHGKSSWVADANWSPSDRWTIGASYQWDSRLRREDLASVRARYLLKDDGIVNLAYRYRRNLNFQPGRPLSDSNQPDLLEQVDFSFLYPINPTWSVVGRYYYSIFDKKPLETVAGVQWESCCIAARLMGRRWVKNVEGELDTGILFEIELKGLGSAGQDTRRTLRRAILGYYRDDLYLVPPETATGQKADPDPTP
ncbi:LPS-assembly protein LptD [Luteimonas cucumeris]|uniref:LPS-assembly protein LptD n=1 Tax=Luteimonas cucumeris TaxID=985012 RepID=UPI0011A0AFB9|nr:LPS-assembly protein LptD [Luteimonas cucumeris]